MIDAMFSPLLRMGVKAEIAKSQEIAARIRDSVTDGPASLQPRVEGAPAAVAAPKESSSGKKKKRKNKRKGSTAAASGPQVLSARASCLGLCVWSSRLKLGRSPDPNLNLSRCGIAHRPMKPPRPRPHSTPWSRNRRHGCPAFPSILGAAFPRCDHGRKRRRGLPWIASWKRKRLRIGLWNPISAPISTRTQHPFRTVLDAMASKRPHTAAPPAASNPAASSANQIGLQLEGDRNEAGCGEAI